MARAEIGLWERPSKSNQPLTYPKITLLVYILHLLVCFSYSTHRNSISTGIFPDIIVLKEREVAIKDVSNGSNSNLVPQPQ